MSFTQNDINSLADKLAQLDLTEAESAVLRNLSGEDEVSGFSMFDFSPLSLRLGPPKNETLWANRGATAAKESSSARNKNRSEQLI